MLMARYSMSKKVIPKDIDMVKPVHGLLAVGQFAVKKNASFGYIRLS